MQDRQKDQQIDEETSPESSKNEFSTAFRIGFLVITLLTIAVGILFARWCIYEPPQPEPEPEPDLSVFKLIMETFMAPINGFYEWIHN